MELLHAVEDKSDLVPLVVTLKPRSHKGFRTEKAPVLPVSPILKIQTPRSTYSGGGTSDPLVTLATLGKSTLKRRRA